MKIIDLRSDTVTLPTKEMYEAIASARLGDDVFEDDPTTIKFEEIAARRIGTEAAMLVASGTMANLVSTLTHCGRGTEAILGDMSHIFLNEAGGMAALGGINPHTIPNQPDGTLKLEDIESAVRGENVHYPRTRLVCLENTHNRCDGAVLTPEYIRSVSDICKRHGLRLHLDGARIFNAAVALKKDVKEFTKHVDSVSFCLSKGLSCPIGSVVCGTREYVKEARRTRKIVGGGMRQTGILAACGIVALEKMIDRLADDHANARRLAQGIAQIPGLSIDPSTVHTNILYFDIKTDRFKPADLVSKMHEQGVQFLLTGPRRYRMVTHYGIEAGDIDLALKALRSVMEQKL